jgi:transposase
MARTTPDLRTPAAGEISSRAECEQGTLSRADIALRSASAPTTVERQRWQVIGLLLDGASVAEIVAATRYSARTIREIAQRYREQGPAALADGRHHSTGAAPLLSKEQQRDLHQALQQPPPDGGAWTGPKVARWIATRTGRRVHRQRGWEYLRRLAGSALPAAEGAENVGL